MQRTIRSDFEGTVYIGDAYGLASPYGAGDTIPDGADVGEHLLGDPEAVEVVEVVEVPSPGGEETPEAEAETETKASAEDAAPVEAPAGPYAKTTKPARGK